ncbi:hypothetical protein [Verrucomicrobium sp. BvORR034]|uniref:hypothetical protein n=1 Tax=Verrucomicrobium sp. BvORR034 TaxID=1396418 RepID=UPI000678B113|nr:hypothetical protein [Verrucomicrobium sp. BvORR034]
MSEQKTSKKNGGAASGSKGDGQQLSLTSESNNQAAAEVKGADDPSPPSPLPFPSPSQHFTIWTEGETVPAAVVQTTRVRINDRARSWRGYTGRVVLDPAVLDQSKPAAPILQESVLVTLEESGMTTYQKVGHLDLITEAAA